MTLNLLKRAESASPLTAVQHDTNLTAIEDEVNSLEAAVGTRETPAGAQAKADAAQAAAVSAAAIDATAKANAAVSIAAADATSKASAAQAAAISAAATDATTKANAAQAAAVAASAPSSHVGSGGTAHAAATGSVAGFMSAADKTKLDSVSAGATANATDADLRNRATHTGTQPIATVSGLQAALDGKEASGAAAGAVAAHVGQADPHAQYALESSLATVATSGAFNDLGGRPTTLAGYGIGDATPSSHVGAGGTQHAAATGSTAGFMSATDKTKLDGIAAGATANATDAQLRDRSTHTGTQAASTVTMAAARLLGRTTAGSGPAEEIAVGSGLTLAGGTLSASGGGGLPNGITSPGDGALAAAAGTLTTSRPSWDATQTWNAAGVTFTGWRINITDTASALASLLMDLQVGGASRFAVRKDGQCQLTAAPGLPIATPLLALRNATGTGYIDMGVDANGARLTVGSSGNGPALRLENVITLAQPGAVNWTNGDVNAAVDLSLQRDAANTLAQRRGTNAQESRVYGTFTDANNHRRVALGMSTAGAGYLRPEGAGTGASGNTLQISTGATTVASLPSASTAGAGARLFVTDANATTFAAVVAGGGSNGVPVYSDGTNWRIG